MAEKESLEWRKLPLSKRLEYALRNGISTFIVEDVEEARLKADKSVDVIEGPLRDCMKIICELLNSGEVFIPEIVKSASVFKKASEYLMPFIKDESVGEIRPNGKIIMATVKGDVHDVGKKITCIILQCHNYDVIDMGIMVPCEDILDKAKNINADVIGLSGLIAPSLNEMVYFLKEVQRQNIGIPIMIGGAATSKAHFAVKIDPHLKDREKLAVYVPDALRTVSVVSQIMDKVRFDRFRDETRDEYSKMRCRQKDRKSKATVKPYAVLAQCKFKTDWESYTPPVPTFLGTKVFDDYPLEGLIENIDWTPFFMAWGLAGKYPNILKDEVVGEAATNLFNDAQSMLKRIVEKKSLKAKAVIGFWPAAQVDDDDIEIFTDEGRSAVLTRLHHVRQQNKPMNSSSPHYCLADFIAPKGVDSADYLGGFIVCAGLGAEEISNEYEADLDYYSSFMVKILAYRLAEAFAETMHCLVRKEYWGYASEENLSKQEIIEEKYRGIRPAPGYPAYPDHTEKAKLFDLLNGVDSVGVRLTESYAMYPAASVSGFYFSHPEARYFGVGKIEKDQLKNIAVRKGSSVDVEKQWLSPILASEEI